MILIVLAVLSALGCGLVAGIFFAFSNFVMAALARLPPAEGMAAMSSINVTVLNPLFLATFCGTAVACVGLILSALRKWNEPQGICLIAGSALYLVGTFLVTTVFNVPLNEMLATVTPASPDSASRWAEFLASWTFWNHVRTVASLAAAALLTVAVCYQARGFGAIQ